MTAGKAQPNMHSDFRTLRFKDAQTDGHIWSCVVDIRDLVSYATSLRMGANQHFTGEKLFPGLLAFGRQRRTNEVSAWVDSVSDFYRTTELAIPMGIDVITQQLVEFDLSYQGKLPVRLDIKRSPFDQLYELIDSGAAKRLSSELHRVITAAEDANDLMGDALGHMGQDEP